MGTVACRGSRAIGVGISCAFASMLLACADIASSAEASDVDATTATPIKHIVVVFQENVPFDRYFGTYPVALNLPGEPRFVARRDTPTVNGLTEALLHHNPNAANPRRLAREQPNGCGSNHGYTAEQLAEDHGLADHFVEENGNHQPRGGPTPGPPA